MALSPQAIAEKGESIYNAKYRAEYEKRYFGQYVAIDIETGQAFVATRPEAAIEKAEQAIKGGLFHVIRIGHSGVYHVSHTATANTANGKSLL